MPFLNLLYIQTTIFDLIPEMPYIGVFGSASLWNLPKVDEKQLIRGLLQVVDADTDAVVLKREQAPSLAMDWFYIGPASRNQSHF